MPTPPSDDHEARMLLAAVSEPTDPVTGALVGRVGAIETVRLITVESPPPVGDAVEVGLWRRRLAARLNPRVIDLVRDETERHRLSVLTPDDPGWPAELRCLGDHAPLALWASGDLRALAEPIARRIALVGARAASAYGEHVATEFAADLVEHGDTIISGGAYGIDGAAHRAAMATRAASTVALLAGGLDRTYPIGHRELFDRIRDGGGALLSELPPGAAPTRWRFLARNRLIAALGGVTVVVEAGWRSGALSIADHAGALGRPVGAVPGPITSVIWVLSRG